MALALKCPFVSGSKHLSHFHELPLNMADWKIYSQIDGSKNSKIPFSIVRTEIPSVTFHPKYRH